MSDDFADKYKLIGEQKFYNFLLTYAINKLLLIKEKSYKGMSPELELLEYHDKFLTLYRRGEDEVNLELSKVFRKAAHKIYRLMLKKDMSNKNSRFINSV